MPRRYGPTAPGVAALMPYANTILGAIRDGATVAGLWQAVNDAYAAGGPEFSGAGIFDMNFVAGNARSILSAEHAFTNAEPTDAMTADMWAWAPWADQSTPSWGEPQYQVRYSYELESPAGERTILWGQTDWQGSLEGPTSRISDRVVASAQQQLLDPSPKAAQALGTLEGSELLGVQNIQVLRI